MLLFLSRIILAMIILKNPFRRWRCKQTHMLTLPFARLGRVPGNSFLTAECVTRDVQLCLYSKTPCQPPSRQRQPSWEQFFAMWPCLAEHFPPISYSCSSSESTLKYSLHSVSTDTHPSYLFHNAGHYLTFDSLLMLAPFPAKRRTVDLLSPNLRQLICFLPIDLTFVGRMFPDNDRPI